MTCTAGNPIRDQISTDIFHRLHHSAALNQVKQEVHTKITREVFIPVHNQLQNQLVWHVDAEATRLIGNLFIKELQEQIR